MGYVSFGINGLLRRGLACGLSGLAQEVFPVNELHLDTRLRWELAQQILSTIRSAVAHSKADLRGSLAHGNADPYSDIDVLWEVPDAEFNRAIEVLPEVLSQVRAVESIRSDPDFQRSDRRRLFFVQFKALPLFWRVDIDILALSVKGDLTYDLHNQAARGDDWSRTHSALMNAIAAIKATLRGQKVMAKDLVVRGLQRVGVNGSPVQEEVGDLIVRLVETVRAQDPQILHLADQVLALHREACG